MRRRIIVALLRQLFAHSRFRISLIVVLTTLLWGGMFWMFDDGFSFLQSAFVYPETYAMAVGGLFSCVLLRVDADAGVLRRSDSLRLVVPLA